MNRSALPDAELLQRYRSGERWASICASAGVSRIALWKRLMRMGERADRHPVTETVACSRCGVEVERLGVRAGVARHAYCSRDCYLAWIREQGKGYRPYRHGGRLARAAVEKVFPLGPGMVVHHWDGDQSHNRLENLAVFASGSEHLSFHRGGVGRPIWDGRGGDEPA